MMNELQRKINMFGSFKTSSSQGEGVSEKYQSMYIISKTFGARQLFMRRNGAQMIPTKVSAHVGEENLIPLAQS